MAESVETYFKILFILASIFIFFEIVYSICFIAVLRDGNAIQKNRNTLLEQSNDIRKQTFVEKYKPQIKANIPPYEIKEYPEAAEIAKALTAASDKRMINAMSDSVRSGKGVGDYFSFRKES